MTPPKLRLDQRLTELGLATTRARAQALVMAGSVTVDGKVTDKPGTRVLPDAVIEVKEELKYVSRGGGKLAPGLAAFGLDPAGKTCLDVGASTGGFTDVLLQAGARKVYAVDVGKGLLYWRLRQDPRVTTMESVNARYLKPGDFPEPIEFAVIDVSFISLALILPAVTPLLVPGAKVVALVKPQFEVGKDKVGKGGVVRDEEAIAGAVDKVAAAARGLGLIEAGRMPAPIKGPKGNQEYLLYLELRPPS